MKVTKNFLQMTFATKKNCNLFIALLEQRGLNVSLSIFDRFGGWPAVKGDFWKEGSWTWQKAVHDCRTNGYSVDFIMGLYVEADFKNSSRRIVYVRIRINLDCRLCEE